MGCTPPLMATFMWKTMMNAKPLGNPVYLQSLLAYPYKSRSNVTVETPQFMDDFPRVPPKKYPIDGFDCHRSWPG